MDLSAFQPAVQTLATGFAGLAVLWATQELRKRNILQAASNDTAASAAANVAVQNAVGNFAGKVMTGIATGQLTVQDVVDGKAAPALAQYAASTVQDSMAKLGVTEETLATMLVGKVGNALGVAPAVTVLAPDVAAVAAVAADVATVAKAVAPAG